MKISFPFAFFLFLPFLIVTRATGSSGDSNFTVYPPPESGDIVISEIYADPKNSNGLPNIEFVELYNTSDHSVDLTGWKICDKVRCAVFPVFQLQKDSLLIVCSAGKETALHAYGSVIGLPHFPSLNNGEERLYLKNRSGEIVHQVHYTKETYHDKDKSNGGWTLEMQFPQHSCLIEGNWSASNATIGGTPGKLPNNTNSPPDIQILNLSVKDSLHLRLKLNIAADREALQKADFSLNKEKIKQILPDSTLSGVFHIILKKPLQKSKRYIFRINGLNSCGLQTGKGLQTVFALPEKPQKGDLLFNEILFNPLKRGGEFIEIYNTSNKIIDLSQLYLANKRQEEWYQTDQASTTSYYLLPGEYVAITKDKAYLLQQYFPKFPDHILEVERLPSFPNTAGNAYLLDASKEVLDHFSYTKSNQSSFLHNKKGVSLEKTYPALSSTSAAHWVSAASEYDFATPGYRNSQYQPPGTQSLHFKVKPETFSPDHDGMKDLSYLIYRLPAGYSGKITIFDEQGLPVRHLRKNVSLATRGKISWDGKNDKGNLLPSGIYIFFIEVYHPSGKSAVKKLPVILVKKH